GEVTGFAAIGEVRDEDLAERNIFEIYAIYIAPEVWGSGIGKALMDSALATVPTGAAGASLWILKSCVISVLKTDRTRPGETYEFHQVGSPLAAPKPELLVRS
ncbi:MAG TPA: GNAT family N-acetyltransferase, partial [Candidatus Nanopelagicaceae bacterium]|nr:GNAT family N-acetyltransferase [Candidatus Nanopelagicaceae bacterium]